MPTLQLSARLRQNFLGKRLGHASVGDRSLYCIEQRLSLHLGAKETLLLASIKPQKSRLFPKLESFRKD